MSRRQKHRAGLRMHRTTTLQLATACAALLFARQAHAQETNVNSLRTDSLAGPVNNAPAASDGERVLLEEVMPALAGSPEGTVPVAQAPAPGTSMTVSRADVQRALAQAGMRESLKAKDIPKSMKVSRESLTL